MTRLKLQRSIHRHPILLICGFALSIALAALGTTVWKEIVARDAAANQPKWELQNLAHSLADHAIHTLAQISLELAQPSSVLAMVEAKLGIAVVPMLVAPIESHPALTIRRLVRPSVSRTIFFVEATRPVIVARRVRGLERPG